MLNPIRNVEKSLGPGGPSEVPGKLGYDPKRHRPHNYPVKRLVTGLGPVKPPKVAKIGYEEGGGVDSMDEPMPEDTQAPEPMDLREPDDQLSPRDQKMKEVVIEAMAALRGAHPDAQKAIQKFISIFGEQDFKELRQMVLGQGAEPDEDDIGDAGGMQVGGLLRGPGSGQDDQIEAATPTGRKVLLSDGEYVIDAPTVAALGDGSTDAGARRLDKFRQSVRKQAYGHEEQAKPMRKGGRAALLEALNS
jgi:hypothetical protein